MAYSSKATSRLLVNYLEVQRGLLEINNMIWSEKCTYSMLEDPKF